MKRTLPLIALVSLLIGLVLVSCSRSVSPEPQPPDELTDLIDQLLESPRPDEEAELMAMWLGTEVAYTRDYDRIRNALKLVRDTYRNSIPQLDSIQFTYYSEVGRIYVFLTDPAVAQLRAGSYTDWDSLNTLYRAVDIDTSNIANQGEVSIYFKGRLKPELMGAIYAGLPSIWHYGINQLEGDRSNIYPWPDGDAMTFLLREADGDCPSGCTHSHFWYFRVINGHAELIGDYDTDSASAFPDWWSEGELGFCTYFNYRHPYCEIF